MLSRRHHLHLCVLLEYTSSLALVVSQFLGQFGTGVSQCQTGSMMPPQAAILLKGMHFPKTLLATWQLRHAHACTS